MQGQAIRQALDLGNSRKTQTLTIGASAAIPDRANELAASSCCSRSRNNLSGAVPDCAQHAWRTATEK
jgi:hypothetical protein